MAPNARAAGYRRLYPYRGIKSMRVFAQGAPYTPTCCGRRAISLAPLQATSRFVNVRQVWRTTVVAMRVVRKMRRCIECLSANAAHSGPQAAATNGRTAETMPSCHPW